MKKFHKHKKRLAQQLVEFLLVAPFIIIILGIVTEYAYALNINMTLTQGLKDVTSSIYSEIKPGMSTEEITALVKADLADYLVKNNIPLSDDEKELAVGSASAGDTAIFMASYRYVSAFTLPSVYIKFLPEEFDFFATSAVPSVFLNGNNYGSSITSNELDTIWSTKDGIMTSTTGRDKMLFLIPANGTVAPGLIKPYQIKTWSGATGPYIVDATNKKLYTCAVFCSDSGETFFGHYSNYTNIMFVHDPGNWPDVLSRILSLVNTAGKSIGNYDNIDVSTYNPNVSSGSTYSVKVLNSRLFVYTSSDAGNAIIP